MVNDAESSIIPKSKGRDEFTAVPWTGTDTTTLLLCILQRALQFVGQRQKKSNGQKVEPKKYKLGQMCILSTE